MFQHLNPDRASDGLSNRKRDSSSKNPYKKPAQKKSLQKNSNNNGGVKQTASVSTNKRKEQESRGAGKKNITYAVGTKLNKQARIAQSKQQQEDIKHNKPPGMTPSTYLQLKDPAATDKMIAQAKFADYKKSQLKQLKRDKYAKTQFNSKVRQFERTLVQRKIDYGSDEYNKLTSDYFPGYDTGQGTTNLQSVQKKDSSNTGNTTIQSQKNKTGLPDNLKSGIENLSGMDISNVKVHRNSDKPASLNAHAYTQGTDIHVAPGQDKHLPHEAWHVVQQMQGRVKPTTKIGDTAINDNTGLEDEADVMGNKALQMKANETGSSLDQPNSNTNVVQRLTGYEVETNIPVFGKFNDATVALTEMGKIGFTEEIGWFLTGGLKYGLNYGEDPEGRYSISADHNDLMSLHRRLIDKLVILGLLKENFKHRSLANIEYITPPRPEVGPGAIDEHKKDITAVKTHLNSTLAIAGSRKIGDVPTPGEQILTGIPVSALLAWVRANNIDPKIIATELIEIVNTINNSIYVQETSGVLPEDIPTVYDEASKAMKGTESPTKRTKLMAGIMDASRIIGEEALNIESLPEIFSTHKKAVVGYLTLIASYLLADNISFLETFSKSKSTSKNLLPFMSKTRLRDTIASLPVAVRPTATEDDPWLDLTTKLTEAAEKYPTSYWAETYGMVIDEDKDKGDVFPEGADMALLNLVCDSGDVTDIITGNILGLDEPHAEVEKASGQKAIPLEDRYFGKKSDEKLTSENMEEAIGARFKFASGLNLSHIPETGGLKAKMILETSTAKNPKQLEESLIGTIKDRIKSIRKMNSFLYPGVIPDSVEPSVVEAELEMEDALKKQDPEKGLGLKAVDSKVYKQYTALHYVMNRVNNANQDKDGNILFKDSVGRIIETFDAEFGRKLLDFNKKGITAEALSEELDVEAMKQHLRKINLWRLYYSREKEKLVAMNTNTEVSERLAVMANIRKSIINIGKVTKDAEEFFDSKPKVEAEETVKV